MKQQAFGRTIAVATLAMLATAAVTTWAQAPQDLTPGTMTALISEVRQLRAAVEDGSKRQNETQAMSVYLSAQQSRMVQISQQLEAVRKELATVSGTTTQFQATMKSLFGDTTSIDPDERKAAEGMLAMFKPQLEAAQKQEENLRAREAELAQALVTEDARWRELIGRLEQMIKR